MVLGRLYKEKKVELLEAEACPGHVHILVSIPPYLSVAQFMGYLKSKSALMIFDRHANLKYRYGQRNFRARGYFVVQLEKRINKRSHFKWSLVIVMPCQTLSALF